MVAFSTCFRIYIDFLRALVPIVSYATEEDDNELYIGKSNLFSSFFLYFQLNLEYWTQYLNWFGKSYNGLQVQDRKYA